MRAEIDRDIIVHVTPQGDTEIGSIPPGVDLVQLYAYHEQSQSCTIRNFRIYSGTWPVLELVM